MWDIKYLNATLLLLDILLFHLNHVGYKALFLIICLNRFADFHLNHVGYKDMFRRAERKKSKTFHLNHVGYKVGWNGNFSNRICHFHLNHVGYKEKTRKLDCSFIKLSSEPCGI